MSRHKHLTRKLGVHIFSREAIFRHATFSSAELHMHNHAGWIVSTLL